MYSKYKHIYDDVPELIECSICFGHPLFTNEQSYLSHYEEFHQSSVRYQPSVRRSSRVTENEYISVKQGDDIDLLKEKILTHESHLSEVKDQIQWLITVIHDHRGIVVNRKEEREDEKVIGIRKRPSRLTVLNENAARLKQKEIDITEKLRKLKFEQEEVEEKLSMEQKQCEDVISTTSETKVSNANDSLQNIMVDNFKNLCNKINNLDSKLDSKVLKNRTPSNEVQFQLKQKDQQIQSFKDQNETLLRRHAEVKAELTILKTRSVEKPDQHQNECNLSLDELSYQTKKLKMFSEVWESKDSRTKEIIENSKTEVRELQKQLADKDLELASLSIDTEIKFKKHLHIAGKKIKLLKEEKSQLEINITELQISLHGKEAELKRHEDRTKMCKQEAYRAEKLLLEGCIRKLEEKFDIENKTKEEKIADMTSQINRIEKSFKLVSNNITVLKKEKMEILLKEEEKEVFYKKEKERFDQIEKAYSTKVKSLEQRLIESETSYEKDIEEAITNLKAEHEKDIGEVITNLKADQEKDIGEAITNLEAEYQNTFDQQQVEFGTKINLKEKEISIKEQTIAEFNTKNEDLKVQLHESNVSLTQVNKSLDLVQKQTKEQIERRTVEKEMQQKQIDSLQNQLNQTHAREQELNRQGLKYQTRIKELEEQLQSIIKENVNENERVMKKNNNLKKQLELCMKELDESKSKVISMETPIITSTCGLNNTTKVISLVCSSSEKKNIRFDESKLNVDDFIADLDEILNSEEIPKQQQSKKASSKNLSEQVTEDITVSDYYLDDFDLVEDAESAENTSSTSKDVSFDFDDEILEDLPTDCYNKPTNVVIIESKMITELCTDEKSNSINKDACIDGEVLVQTEGEKSEDITVSNLQSEDIKVSNLQSNRYDYSELAQPIENDTQLKHDTQLEHDTHLEHNDKYADDHFEEISSVSNSIAELSHSVTKSASVSNSIAELSHSVTKSASVSHNISKSAIVSHSSSKSASVFPSISKSSSVSRSSAKSASHNYTNSASVSHSATKSASELQHSGAKISSVSHSDAKSVNEARGSSISPMNDTNSNDESSRLNELLDEYLNESFKENENDERSRDQHSIASSSCSKASHSSTTVSRDDNTAKNTFHATTGMHEEEEKEICEESIDEELSEEEIPGLAEFVANICINDSSENLSANHSLEHLSTNQGLVSSQHQLMSDVHVAQTKNDMNIALNKSHVNIDKRFTKNLPPLIKSKSLLLSAVANDVDEIDDDGDVSFGDVDIDDLLDEIQPIESFKQQHKPIKFQPAKNFY